jgi:YidC/Oxa1 family membrane protein insertase
LSAFLAPFAGEASAALAIVLLTVMVRALLVPVARSQIKAETGRRRIAPQLAHLQKTYAKRPEELQRKTLELYRSEKVSPLAGCLPMLAQIPVLSAVYGLFVLPAIGGHANALLQHTAFGVPLGSSLVHGLGSGAMPWQHTLVFVVIMLVIALVAQASRMLLKPASTAAVVASHDAGTPLPPSAMAGVTKALSFLPFMTALVAGFVPLAAGLYLLVTVTWTLGERLVLRRLLGYGPLDTGSGTASAA